MIMKLLITGFILLGAGWYIHTVATWWHEGDEHFKPTKQSCSIYKGFTDAYYDNIPDACKKLLK